jgi:6-phosphofructokinase 1
MTKNMGIITPGGEAGGLNAVIRGAAPMIQAQGMKAFVIPNGYA